MTLLEAAQAKSLPQAARLYLLERLSVVPLQGKQARYWKAYQKERANFRDISIWEQSGQLQNIGIICGEVSDNLVVIDLDGWPMMKLFTERWPALLNTFTVTTGSGQGKHLYYRLEYMPRNQKLSAGEHSGIEVRGNGQYVVAPPSIHPDTHQPYTVTVEAPIKKLYEMSAITEWLTELTAQSKPTPPPIPIPRSKGLGGGVPTGRERWAAAALYYESRDAAGAVEGARNNQLYKSAYNLGQIVADGDLSSDQVEVVLAAAARKCGLPEGEALATIRSGLKDGLTKPRSQQWSKRRLQ